MIDLDIGNFDYDNDRLERILKQTLRRIKELLAGFRPTVIWSGR